MRTFFLLIKRSNKGDAKINKDDKNAYYELKLKPEIIRYNQNLVCISRFVNPEHS